MFIGQLNAIEGSKYIYQEKPRSNKWTFTINEKGILLMYLHLQQTVNNPGKGVR